MKSGILSDSPHIAFVFPWDLFTITKLLKIATSIESGGCVLHPQSSCWMHALFLFSSHLYTVSSVLHASVSVSRSAPSKGAEICTSGTFYSIWDLFQTLASLSACLWIELQPHSSVFGRCLHCWTGEPNNVATGRMLTCCLRHVTLGAVFPAVHVAERFQTWHHSQLDLH